MQSLLSCPKSSSLKLLCKSNGYRSNLTKNPTFKAVAGLVRDLGTVCPVTPSRVYMQTCTVLQANVNRVETWTVRLWREAESVAIRDLVRDSDQSTLQTARILKLEVFATCEPGDALWNIAVHIIQCSHSRHLGSEQRRSEQARQSNVCIARLLSLPSGTWTGCVSDPLLWSLAKQPCVGAGVRSVSPSDRPRPKIKG